jgi:sterol desaturase/sphingolipid hydroxylase (fatty acid hydroxylase superfamily)
MAADITLEPALRLAGATGVLLAMMLWELRAPFRPLRIGRARRWPANIGIVVLDAVLVRLLVPVTAAGAAVYGGQHGYGVLNAVAWPAWLEIALAVLLLDFAIYLQHRLFHAVPALWRLHRMHHADQDFDATTGNRFHPFEILLSMLIKIALVLALGIPAEAIVLFEILLNASSTFNHGNVRLPARLEPLVRAVLVTPDMHRVHHSIVPAETHSNFGFCLPWWDRLLRTYRAMPAASDEDLVIGLPQFRDVGEQRLDRMLTQPFRC